MQRQFAQARRRGDALIKRLVPTAGPLFTETDVASRFGVRVSAVRAMVHQGQLIAVHYEDALRYPAWQFDGAGVRWFVAQIIRATGNPQAAFYFIAVPRKRYGENRYQPYLAQVLANDIPAIHEMLRRAESLREL
jgi:hypothetical protein